MKVTYIYHSCFAIEGEGYTLLIDFFKDTDKDKKGLVSDYLLKRPGKFYVLSSHFHPDHFNRRILEWKTERKDINYIFSSDILESKRAGEKDASYIGKSGVYKDELLSIKAYGSTDIGISFFIELEGKKIFHAGDLNNWHWKEESTPEESQEYETNFQRELEDIRKDISSFDLVMFPVDPRLGEEYMLGAKQFLNYFSVKVFVPMHFSEEYQKAAAFREYAESKGTSFVELTHKGQSFEI